MAKRLSAADKKKSESFALVEYKNLRERSHELVRRIDELERNVVIACGAVFVFSVSSKPLGNAIAIYALYWLPFFISLLGITRYIGLTKYLLEVNKYTKTLESELGGSPGWLNHYYRDEPNARDEQFFASFRKYVWGFLVAANIFAGLILTWG